MSGHDAAAEAQAFVRDLLLPALAAAEDDGNALMHAVIDAVFFDAAYRKLMAHRLLMMQPPVKPADLDLVGECITSARAAIERAIES